MTRSALPTGHLDLADRRAVDAVNAASADEPPVREVWSAVEEAIARHADRTAVVTAAETVTYSELDTRVAAFAARLAEAGIERDLVAVALPKSVDQVAAVLAVLARGGAFLPVPKRWPAARRDAVLQSAQPTAIVDEDGLHRLATDTETAAAPARLPAGTAYVIYTSGSTGTPKGVTVSSTGAMCTVDASVAEYRIGPDDRILGLSSLAFDLSVWDLFAALTSGATLVLPDDSREGAEDPDELLGMMRRHSITVTMGAPALIDLIVLAAEADNTSNLPDWRLVLTGGDWIPLQLPGRAAAIGATGMEFVSIGGATECSLFSVVHRVDEVSADWSSIPYGRAVAGHTAYVLDDDGGVCRIGETGDIWYGGRGVGLGYWRDADRTAEVFRAHPVTGERMYRSGDRGRYASAGHIELLGRADRQIQLRGYRIELGEVETALLSVPGVQAAVVTTRVRRTGPPAVTGVVAHAVAPDLDPPQIMERLVAVLPDYAVPAAVLVHEAFPLTSNGKWDRDTLAAMAENSGPARDELGDLDGGVGVVEGDADLADAVAEIWEAELGGTRVTGSADFFALGGDSLSAVRVIYRLRSELGLQVRMSALQETPMLRDFVAGLSQDAGGPPAAGAEHVAIVSEPDRRHEPFPLTDQQQAYVLGRGDDFASGRVACHVYVEYRAVPGRTVELDRLNRAWQQVIDRHDALRIVIDPETMTQRVLTDVPELQVETVTGEHAAAQVRERLSHEVRDPAVWPLFAVVAELDDDRRVRRLMLSVDALISDFRGLRVMLDDLETFYRGTPLEPLDVTFRDYVLAARALDDGPAGVAGAAYWAERVHDLPDGPRLPMIAAPDDLAKPRFVARHHRLSAERWAAVRDRAAAWGVTSTAVLVGCYAATLARWSETGHFTLNIPNFNRLPLHGQVDHLIGEFATFVLLEVTVDPDEPFADFCRRIQRRLWDDMDAGRRSGVSVLRDVAAVRGGLDSPFAPVVLTSEVAIDGGEHDAVLDGALIEDYAVTQTPQVWMDMRIEERAGVLRVNWDVMDELFPSGLPDELFAHFIGALDAVASGATPADVTGDGVVDAELHGPSAPAAALAHSRILDAMRADPRAPLVDDGDRVWSRGEIGMAACRVTGRLRAAGVGRSDLVAVILDRGAAQFAAVYGVLGAGATYVPVDPDLPADRIRSILDAAGPAAVLHDRRSGPQPGVDSIAIEELVEGQRPEPGTLESWLDSAASAASPTDRAYVLFTSGSTGKPKGVMVRHDALSACVDATIGRFGLNADTRSLAVSALHHDMSVFDFFVVPAAGGAAVTVDHGLRRDPIHWAERSAEGGAGALCAVPAMVTMLCDGLVHEPVAAAGLRLVLTGGDRVSPQLVTRLRASSPEIVVASIGGPTETTAWNIWHVVQADAAVPEPVPYGTPIAGTSYRIVDDHGRTRPRWVTGEMEVSGVSVADGYLGADVLTRAVFAERDGVRTFRTGDRGFVNGDGEIVFVGRADDQVKIRGNRIEPGEVEAHLRAVPGVVEAAVVVFADPDGQPGGLIGYVTGEVTEHAVADQVRRTLPETMVPSRVVVLDAIPLSPNGKIDRRALPEPRALGGRGEPSARDVEHSDAEPATALEEMLCLVWGRELGADRVRPHDNFFSLGGNSLLASRIIMRLREAFADTGISLRVVVNTKDVSAMAEALRGAEPHPGTLEQIAQIYLEVEQMAEAEVDQILS